MIIFETLQQLKAASLQIGKVVNVLGVTTEGDKAVINGRVRAPDYVPINPNQLVTIANGNKVELFPGPGVFVTTGQMRTDSASQLGLVYKEDYFLGIEIPDDAMKDKLAYWYNGQFYTVGTDTGFKSTDFDDDLLKSNFINAKVITLSQIAIETTSTQFMLEGRLKGGAQTIPHQVGQTWCTGGTKWRVEKISDPMTYSDFYPLTDICADDFGIIPNDPSAAEQNSIMNRQMIADVLEINQPSNIDGIGANYYLAQLKPTISYLSGIYYFDNNPFKPAPAEYDDTSDKVLGLKFAGQGMESTIFELRKRSGFVGTANFYSNAGVPGKDTGFGGWKNITFEDMTFRSPYFANNNYESMAKRAGNDWYSWGSIESGGWEKFFKFERVMFQGLDEILLIQGTSNCDENHWTNCRFEVIRENVLRLINDQSVIHRFDHCDFEGVHGNFAKVTDGGWVVINGGSVILYPEFNLNGPVARTTKSAVFNIEANGSNLDSRAGVYKMRDVSVEKYDPNVQFARVKQIGTVTDIGDETLVPRYPASVADIDFVDTSFRIDTVRSDDKVNHAGNHDVVSVIGDILAKVNLRDCELNQRHFYDMGPTSFEYSDGSYIRFTRPRLAWDPSKTNVVPQSWEGGTLADRCSTGGGGSILCEGATCITTPAWIHKSYNYNLNFVLSNNSVFNYARQEKTFPVKRAGEKMLSTGETPTRTGNTLYLYKGVIVTGGQINIPASVNNNTGVVEVYAGSTLIHETPIINLTSGYKAEFEIPYIEQAELVNDTYIHVKWANYSGLGTEVPFSSEVLIKYK